MSFLESPVVRVVEDDDDCDEDVRQTYNDVDNDEQVAEDNKATLYTIDEDGCNEGLDEHDDVVEGTLGEDTSVVDDGSLTNAPARPSSVATMDDSLNASMNESGVDKSNDAKHDESLNDMSSDRAKTRNNDIPDNDGEACSQTAVGPSSSTATLVPAKTSTQILNKGGLNLKHYEDQMHQLKNENFRLKLRIHFLETDYGLLPAARNNHDKENVYRINLDLRVAHESLKAEVESKTSLLKAAYEAMEEQEQERLREKNVMQSQIDSLRQTMMESQLDLHPFTKPHGEDTDSSFAALKGGEATRRFLSPLSKDDYCTRLDRESLLREAFGSIDLGEQHQEQTELNKDSEKIVEKEKDEEISDKKLEELKRLLDSKTEECLVLVKKQEEVNEEVEAKQQLILHLQSELAKQSRDNKEEVIEKEKEKQQQITDLKEDYHLKALECERKSDMMDQIKKQFENELQGLKERLQSMNTELGQREVQFSAEIQLYKAKLDTRMNENESLESQMNELKLHNSNLEELRGKAATELEKRDRDFSVLQRAFDKLKGEYERVKDIVRKQRSISVSTTRSEGHGVEERETDCNTSNEKGGLLSSHSILSGEHGCDKGTYQQGQKGKPIVPLKKTIEKEALVNVAAQVLQRAHKEYSAVFESRGSSSLKVINALRNRLMELVSFLQKLLSDDNISSLSDDFRDALNKSMDESRRMSINLSRSLLLPLEEELTSTPAADVVSAALDLSDIYMEVNEPQHLPQIVFKPSELLTFATTPSIDEVQQFIDFSEGKLYSELEKALEVIQALRVERLELIDDLAKIKHELESNTKEVVMDLANLEAFNDELRQENNALRVQSEDEMKRLDEISEANNDLKNQLERAEIELFETRRELERVIEDSKDRFDQMEAITNERVRELEKQTEMLNDAKTRLELRLIKAKNETTVMSKDEEEPTSSSMVNNKTFNVNEDNKENDGNENVNNMEINKQSNMCCECQQRVFELERLLSETKALLVDAQVTIEKEQRRKEALEKRALKELTKTKKVLKNTKKM